MKSNLYSIGEVSKIKGLSIKTLRYYHDMGIIVPTYIDEQNGYRYYSPKQFLYIDIVKGCRSLGISIKEIQDIFEEKDTNRLMEMLKIKKEEIKKSIIELEEVIGYIDDFNGIVNESNEAIKNELIEIKEFKDRYIVKIECESFEEEKELLYYSLLENRILENKINSIGLGGIIYSYRNGILNQKDVFQLVDDNEKALVNKEIGIIEAGRYIVLNYTKNNENDQRRKLKEYMHKNNLEANEILEFDLINDFFNLNSYSIQLQIKID